MLAYSTVALGSWFVTQIFVIFYANPQDLPVLSYLLYRLCIILTSETEDALGINIPISY